MTNQKSILLYYPISLENRIKADIMNQAGGDFEKIVSISAWIRESIEMRLSKGKAKS